ncbi:WYL domain-containing protein [Ectobacillus antri]|uniref:WYL domain-containing protein n=1 Tax=Ectobacillus antri TaxID=2486280 RepID=A0ABT6H343_9BACI|nr:WYL domain-containing protein [Ectobacillus antri]MDG4656345.1 WYL domain-containing protein [Ectobacillus antri]MDG5753020.1 WYL domain-containing protein [Ectobacillus antri]
MSLFRIDRIFDIEIIEEDPRTYMTLREWLSNEETKEPIKLKVHLTREGIRQCLTNPWLEQYVASDNEAGYMEMMIETSEVRFTGDFFFSLGSDAIVEEPAEMVSYICEKAQSILKLYQNENK